MLDSTISVVHYTYQQTFLEFLKLKLCFLSILYFDLRVSVRANFEFLDVFYNFKKEY